MPLLEIHARNRSALGSLLVGRLYIDESQTQRFLKHGILQLTTPIQKIPIGKPITSEDLTTQVIHIILHEIAEGKGLFIRQFKIVGLISDPDQKYLNKFDEFKPVE